jgi:hypothetical protein
MRRPEADHPRSIRYRLRRARFRWIERILDDILAEKPVARILDMGGRGAYWKLLDRAYHDRVEITLLNLPEDTAREAPDTVAGLDLRIETGDATDMPQYADGSFDLTHSNSVIEHVGLYSAMARFAAETRRVGRAYYVQTPNFWFPLEPHYGLPFFHWLPEPARLFFHTHTGAGFAHRTDLDDALSRVDHTRIVPRRLMRHFFPDAIQESERLALMTKSMIAYRPWPR